MLIPTGAAAATSRIDEGELATLGFKMLVATTTVQQKWVKTLAPGQIRPMQRNGKKLYIYPDAAKNQVYVGGPQEYAAYRKLHPDVVQEKQDAANKTAAYRLKQGRHDAQSDCARPVGPLPGRDLGGPRLVETSITATIAQTAAPS